MKTNIGNLKKDLYDKRLVFAKECLGYEFRKDISDQIIINSSTRESNDLDLESSDDFNHIVNNNFSERAIKSSNPSDCDLSSALHNEINEENYIMKLLEGSGSYEIRIGEQCSTKIVNTESNDLIMPLLDESKEESGEVELAGDGCSCPCIIM